MATSEERKKTRERLFSSLFASLPEDEQKLLKQCAYRTLQEKPPSMDKSTFMKHVLACCDKHAPALKREFAMYFSTGSTQPRPEAAGGQPTPLAPASGVPSSAAAAASAAAAPPGQQARYIQPSTQPPSHVLPAGGVGGAAAPPAGGVYAA
eukprot:CAMPEP_0181330364 /NCGR_PEP_ID=MMETSP1101-20121128/23859_1 /TAXON_ID=46948 /ORGANISM="Rhodomonas abbreviata, Strain Caron Lab Isolate" /LENGTH=150 /DNA_ID=CAMNT_0023439613 /DNA_START=101 /DNA_END=549 /DNA_ORIENTATION=-